MATEIEKNKKLKKIVLTLSIICCACLFGLFMYIMSIGNERLFNREPTSTQEMLLELFISFACNIAIYLIIFLDIVIVKKLNYINKLLATANIDKEIHKSIVKGGVFNGSQR